MSTWYKKVNKKYVPVEHYEVAGLPEGLYLLYNNNYKGQHTSMKNMSYYTQVHQIQNVGRFCDLVVQMNKEDLEHKIVKEVEHFRKINDRITTGDIINCVLKVISDESR